MNQFAEHIENEIGGLKDSNRNLINSLREDLIKVLKDGFDSAGKVSKKYIKDLESMKNESIDRFKTFFRRWKTIDYFIMADLVITPILFIIVIWFMFLK